MPKTKRKNAIASTRAQIVARESDAALEAGPGDAIAAPALRKPPNKQPKKARGRK